MVSPGRSPARCKRDIGAALVGCGPYVSLIALGNESRHVEWLGPRICTVEGARNHGAESQNSLDFDLPM
jgi:hypothetical protein